MSLNKKSSIALTAALMATVSTVFVVGTLACDPNPGRIRIGKGKGTTAAEKETEMGELDKRLKTIKSKEDNGCLPLKAITDALRKEKEVFSLYTHSVRIGTGLKEDGKGFQSTQDARLISEGIKKQPLQLISLYGDEFGQDSTGTLLAVAEQADCETVTFKTDSGRKSTFNIVSTDEADTILLSNDDEVRKYKISDSNPGVLSIVLFTKTKLTDCKDKMREDVVTRHQLFLNWGENLTQVSLEGYFARTLRDVLVKPPPELNSTQGQTGLDAVVPEEKPSESEQPVKSESGSKILISYPLYEKLQNLVEKGDIKPGKCQ